MKDRIEITGIQVQARHGVLPAERARSQPFVVDVTLFLDLASAGAADDLSLTVDYSRVAQSVHDTVAGESHRLIETVADDVARLLLDDPRTTRVIVTVHKPQAPLAVGFEDVSVTLDRSR